MKLSRALSSLALVVTLTSASAAHAVKDEWDGIDKAKHVAVSALIGTATGAYFENRWTAFGVAMIPGVAKELIDARAHDNHFSSKDLVADAVGAALGVQFGHWIITSRGVSFQSSF